MVTDAAECTVSATTCLCFNGCFFQVNLGWQIPRFFSFGCSKPLGMQASIFGACPKPGYIGRVATGRASNVKMRDDGDASLISPVGVAPCRMVGVSASVIFPCTMKSRRFLLAPAHPGSPGKRAVNRFCVFVCLFQKRTLEDKWPKFFNC